MNGHCQHFPSLSMRCRAESTRLGGSYDCAEGASRPFHNWASPSSTRRASRRRSWSPSTPSACTSASSSTASRRSSSSAQERLKASTIQVDTWRDFFDVFAGDGSRFVLAHWDGTTATEKQITDETKVTIRCLPVPGDGPRLPAKCIKTSKLSAMQVVFAKPY